MASAASPAPPLRFLRRFWHWFCQWPSDVVLWTILFIVVVLLAYFWRSDLLPGAPQKLILHATDANDVKPGANVYFMGVLVGTIEEVRIPFNTHRYDVALHARTRRKLPPLPSNVEGYIVFNGLAGAKEVHLVPPTRPIIDPHGHGKQIIDIENPIRLRDVMATNMEVSEYLQKGAESFSSVFGAGGVTRRIKALQANITEVQNISRESTQQSQKLTRFVQMLETNLHQPLSKTNQVLTPISKNIAHLQAEANQALKSKPLSITQHTLNQLQNTIHHAEDKQTKWHDIQATLHPALRQLNDNLSRFELEGGLEPINQKLESTHEGLTQARKWIQEQVEKEDTQEKPASITQ